MNKLMKKLTAALVALLCMPVTGMTAAAEDLGYGWGTTTWSALDGYEQIDDHGMLTSGYYRNSLVYLKEESIHWGGVVLVTPRTGTIRLVLRDGVDEDEAAQQIAEVVDTYYPGILENYDAQKHSSSIGNTGEAGRMSFAPETMFIPESMVGRVFELYADRNSAETSKEAEAGILLALAKKHLLSEYYGWGQTADYQAGNPERGLILERLPNISYKYDAVQQKNIEIVIDWDEVQAYLTEQYPGLTVQAGSHYSRIDGAEDWSVREKMELMFELWEKFGVGNVIEFPEEYHAPFTGRNALEQPGDVDLDTKINILDVITLNRNLLVGDPLCDTAQKNADTDGSGAPDAADALRILKYIVGIEEDLG